MTEEQLYDEAFRQMSEAPLVNVQREHGDRRRFNRGTKGHKGGTGRPRGLRTLVIDGIVQDGHYVLVSCDRWTIVLQSAARTG